MLKVICSFESMFETAARYVYSAIFLCYLACNSAAVRRSLFTCYLRVPDQHRELIITFLPRPSCS